MPTKIPKDEFIQIWQAAKTRAEAAKRMGLRPESCSNRARFYRKQGIPLKVFPGHQQQGRSGIK